MLGEVQYATLHVCERGLNPDNYIARSGGLSRRADKKRIYVVRANGEVVTNPGASWFWRDSGAGIRPGDAVVVPLDVDQPSPIQVTPKFESSVRCGGKAYQSGVFSGR